jgi:hypothetical protein
VKSKSRHTLMWTDSPMTIWFASRCRFLIATIRVAAAQPPNGVHDPHGLASAGRRTFINQT